MFSLNEVLLLRKKMGTYFNRHSSDELRMDFVQRQIMHRDDYDLKKQIQCSKAGYVI